MSNSKCNYNCDFKSILKNKNKKIIEHVEGEKTIEGQSFYEKNKVKILLSSIWIFTILIEIFIYKQFISGSGSSGSSGYDSSSYVQPYAQQYGQPYGQPYAQQYGQPYEQPYEQPAKTYGYGENPSRSFDSQSDLVAGISGGFVRVMSGGGLLFPNLSLFQEIALATPIIIAMIASAWVIFKYTKRNKCLAYILAFIPPIGFPASRFYTDHMGLNLGTFARTILFPFGNIFDAVQIWRGKMDPENGWSGDGKCNIFKI